MHTQDHSLSSAADCRWVTRLIRDHGIGGGIEDNLQDAHYELVEGLPGIYLPAHAGPFEVIRGGAEQPYSVALLNGARGLSVGLLVAWLERHDEAIAVGLAHELAAAAAELGRVPACAPAPRARKAAGTAAQKGSRRALRK